MPPTGSEVNTKPDFPETTVIRLKSAMQARPLVLIRMLSLESGEMYAHGQPRGLETYPLQIAVHYPPVMHVDQSPSDIPKLR